MFTQEAKEYRERLAEALIEDGHPDYANALYAFNSIILLDEDNPLPGCVSGSSLKINRGLTMEEACLVARHEIIHVRYLHHMRQQNREHELWNIACDIEISNTYDEEDDELMRTSQRLNGGLNINFDEHAEFRGLTAEKVYDILIARCGEQCTCAVAVSGGTGQGNGIGQGSSAATESVEQMRENIKGKEDLLEEITKSICAKIRKAIKKSTAKDNKPKPTVGKGHRKESNSRPDPQQSQQSESEANQAQQKKEDQEASGQGENSQQKNQNMGDGEDFDMGGNGVGTEHAELDKPKPEPTRVKLLRSLKGVFGRQKYYERKRTYSKPNRRLLTPPGMLNTPMTASSRSGIIKKGVARKTKEFLTLGVYCDVSGSMSQAKIALALGACKEIDKLRRCAVKTHYFDTVVSDEFFHGGGTDYNVVLAHAKEKGYKSIAIITDDSSDRIPKGVYQFDNLWIIGVEHSHNDDKEHYSIGPQIIDGTVKVKHFDGFIVCTEDE